MLQPAPSRLIDEPVMQAERPVLPELDPLRDHPKARPEIRPLDLAEAELGGELGDALLQLEARGERPRLARRPGADPAAARPALEIGVRLGAVDRLDRPLDAHLALERLPVEQQRRARIGGEVGALAAFQVGVEDEAAGIDALEQHHPHRRLPGCIHRRELPSHWRRWARTFPPPPSRRGTGRSDRQARR